MGIDAIIRKILRLTPLAVALAAFAAPALAGAGGTEFNPIVTELSDWAEGGLGKVISLAAVIVGAVVSVARSNPMPILSGIAFAMILNFTPDIVTGVLGGAL